MDYADRKLTNVSVWSIERVEYKDSVGVAGVVRFDISNSEGEDEGPNISVTIATPVDKEPTIKEAEDALISAALNAVNRFAQETLETAKLVLASKQPSAFMTKSDNN